MQEILSLDLGKKGHVNELSYCRVVTFVAVEAFDVLVRTLF